MSRNPIVQTMIDQYWGAVLAAVDAQDVDALYDAAIDMKALDVALKSLSHLVNTDEEN